ncbi:MAG: beta-lactamase family protein [Prolixibacteraceae bacterium]|nr:beta-lactamase family protein [Prolixibacteraceae bacterium]MBN2775169.1 beta-lactamase family protein [Prolixibacteraceae bacterium]
MKKLLQNLILFLFVFIISCQPVTTNLESGSPESVGFNSERLALIDQHIQSFIDAKKVPGGVFLIARKGKIVYYKSFGNSKEGVPYKNDDIFRIASMTKAITTVSIMQLYEQGKLGLDEPVFNYIPAFKDQVVLDSFNETDSSYTTVPVNSPVTIRQLLTHTSGIAYGGFNPGKIMAVYEKFGMNNVGLSHESWTTEEFINRLAKVPLAFQPGTRFLYGLNMDVLGRVIEVVSGMPLDKYFSENIFKPLGMTDTYFYLPEEKYDRLVQVFAQTGKGYEPVDPVGTNYPLRKGLSHFAGGGGLSSTALDYAKFIQALVNDGKYENYRLLSRKTIEVMTSDQLIDQNSRNAGISNIPGVTFGLGFMLFTEKAKGLNSKSVGTYEWSGYFNTKFFIDPQEDLIFVGMTQIAPFWYDDFWNKFYAMIYGAIDD